MASLTGAIENGVYTKTDASTAATASNTVLNSSKSADGKQTEYNQEMFLQLLVAEMQYQDPLEPTSNTEYVSELASFTQIETIQNVQNQMQTIQAESLVGKYVILLDDNGEYVSGKVDFVANQDGELMLSVDDGLYSIDQLDTVVDEAYYNAVLTVESFTDAVKKLPTVAGVTLADKETITYARQIYDAMDTYTKGFVSSDTLTTLKELEKRIEALESANADNDIDVEDGNKTEA